MQLFSTKQSMENVSVLKDIKKFQIIPCNHVNKYVGMVRSLTLNVMMVI